MPLASLLLASYMDHQYRCLYLAVGMDAVSFEKFHVTFFVSFVSYVCLMLVRWAYSASHPPVLHASLVSHPSHAYVFRGFVYHGGLMRPSLAPPIYFGSSRD